MTLPAGYRTVEGLHLRQWVLRAVVPLAVLATNGSGWVRLEGLPGHDLPLRSLGLPASAGLAVSVAGVVLVLASAAVRVLAKGVLVRKTVVTSHGIYGVVRHPFYLATVLGAAGVFLIAGPLGAAVGAVWLAAALPVFLVTIHGEETRLAEVHGATWERYAATVPRLAPRSLRLPGGAGVTWSGLVAEHEPPRLLRFLAGACVVGAARIGGTAGIALAAAGALAFAASHLVGRARRG